MPAPERKTEKKNSRPRHVVAVDATFGSAHQRDVAMRILNDFVNAWKETVESRHKKNVITMTHEAIAS